MAAGELYCRFNTAAYANNVEVLCDTDVSYSKCIANLFWIYSQMKGSTTGNLKTHVKRHHIGKAATTPFFAEARKGTHAAIEIREARGMNLFRIHYESILNLFSLLCACHGDSQCPWSRPRRPACKHRPAYFEQAACGARGTSRTTSSTSTKTPERPSMYSESIPNPLLIYSNLQYNIAEIKRMWKNDHTGIKCAFHKGKKNASQ